ncbi:hypothetical protein POPTR_013G031900v4 [Populus trichocarpa]|uniref:Uncharacterized protein n=1 Tax=Populus trichocarpa TaxID=3694 RepID=A0A2K1Y0B4_POPTR|nr:hypothetical protein BDE02_13G029300 [Populus trichocarpa]PNT06466.1 hypothetical protein POPTR_013G031900v4 [Populus trichocarpa]
MFPSHVSRSSFRVSYPMLESFSIGIYPLLWGFYPILQPFFYRKSFYFYLCLHVFHPCLVLQTCNDIYFFIIFCF